jgi:hypothetical protein
MRNRFAGQRLLAERPQGVITDDIADALLAMVEQGEERSRIKGSRGLAIPVGPKLTDSSGRPLQMKMKMEDTPVYAPYDADAYTQDGIGIVTGDSGIIDTLSNTPLVKEVSFGWDDPKKRSGISFDRPNDPAVKRQLAELDMASLLKDAQLKLMDRAGMSAGDLLANSPVGLSDGDFKRAKTYMLQGYGAPDASSGQMFGRIQGDGGLSPVQLYSADPGLMSNLGWANNNDAVRKAQGLLF